MNREQINEVKTQLWEHLRHLQGRIEELWEIGIYPREEEWVGIRRLGRRNRWWILDQLYFCRGEIEFWKGINYIE